MELNALHSTKNCKEKSEKLSKGEYIEVSFNGDLIAEFEYFNGSSRFVGFDYTEDFDNEKHHFIDDLQDGYRINDFFKPMMLLDMLNEWKEEFPRLSITGRTLLQERIDNGTI